MSVEGGVTKYFAWAGGNIIAEYEAWGTNALIWKTSYVYLGGQLLATTSGADGTETQFHHPDRLGTRLVTASTGGDVVTEQLSMPFGTMLPFTQTYGGENSYQHPTLSNPSKKRFTTYDRSAAIGLDYAVNRFYSSQQGRFTQVDPSEMDAVSLDNPQTLNLYAYCGNDPINNLDPEGLSFWGVIGRFFKGVGNAIAAFFGSGMGSGIGGSSGPDFRTPPIFPGNLPDINAAIISGMGGFRTPPFVNGFLQTQQTQNDSSGGFWEKFVNWVDGYGWKTFAEVRAEKHRKQVEAVEWLKANGAADIILFMTPQEREDFYDAVHNNKSEFKLDDGRTIQIVQPGQPGDPAPTPKATPIPPSEVRAAAERLGYNRVVKDPPFKSHGQKVFTNGKDYLTKDIDIHSGGIWKKFNRAGQRIGTYDADLNWIKP